MEQITFTQLPQQTQSLAMLSALSQKIVLLQRLAQNPGEPYRSAWLATAIPSYITYLNSVIASPKNDDDVVASSTELKGQLQEVLSTYNKVIQH